MNVIKDNSELDSLNKINHKEINQNEIKSIRYYWFDSYLEFNMYNCMGLKLMDLEKRYGVQLSYSSSYDDFMKQIYEKKKVEKNKSVSNKCLECEKRKRSKISINSHSKTECKLINGPIKYKNYPSWIKEIINTNSDLYEELKIKSKNTGVKFCDCISYDEFINEFYRYEQINDSMLKW